MLLASISSSWGANGLIEYSRMESSLCVVGRSSAIRRVADNAQGRWTFGRGGQEAKPAENLYDCTLDPCLGVNVVNVPAEEKVRQHGLRPP